MNAFTEAGRGLASGNDDVRVLRRVQLEEGPTGDVSVGPTKPAAVLSVATSGSQDEGGQRVAVSVRRFHYDSDGMVTRLETPQFWSAGTKYVDEVASGTASEPAPVLDGQISEEELLGVLLTSSIIISHRASFDRPWIESLLPEAGGLAWACSATEVDWWSRGFEGPSLGYLLCQTGWFYDAESRAGEVDGLIQLLRHRFDDGRSVLSLLVERALRTSWIFRAHGASFAVKEQLRDRGYRWDAERRVWWKEISDAEKLQEELWLAINVYRAGKGARAMGPYCEQMTAEKRFI